MDQDTDFARLADMAGDRKRQASHTIDVPHTTSMHGLVSQHLVPSAYYSLFKIFISEQFKYKSLKPFECMKVRIRKYLFKYFRITPLKEQLGFNFLDFKRNALFITNSWNQSCQLKKMDLKRIFVSQNIHIRIVRIQIIKTVRMHVFSKT